MPPTPPLARLLCQLRNLNVWLLLAVLLLAWPHMQTWLEALTDRETAVWLPLGNPASKIVVTLLVTALGVGFCWIGLKLNHTTAARWATQSFKHTFTNLTDPCKLQYFTVYWFGWLFFFALVWVGACLIQ